MRWNTSTQDFTGRFTPQEGVVAIEWRRLNDLRNSCRNDAEREHLGIHDNENWDLPRDAIRIYSIKSTEENAQLHDYPPGRSQPRPEPGEVQYLNDHLPCSAYEDSYADFRVRPGSRVHTKNTSDNQQMELLVPGWKQTGAQVLTKFSNDSTATAGRDGDTWKAEAHHLDQETWRMINESRYMCVRGLRNDGVPYQSADRYLGLGPTDPRFRANGTEMVFESNTQFLEPREGVKPENMICGIHIPTEPSENQVFPFGEGATEEIIPKSAPEYETEWHNPTHRSIVNLRWLRRVSEDDPQITTTQPSTTMGDTTASTQPTVLQRLRAATSHGTGRRRGPTLE